MGSGDRHSQINNIAQWSFELEKTLISRGIAMITRDIIIPTQQDSIISGDMEYEHADLFFR